MEFRFRRNEENPSSSFSYSPPPPSSSTSTYFTEQALRMGYFSNGIKRTYFVRNSDRMREAIQIELEKERIREEIIAAEILRKRALEAELRRGMALEI
ncbi:hypothetical protein BVC80_7915g3 [Macleaya cordata]|uniref:Uncharacterized protein n=1 Tax=Macleaya cordata TaxID=56857 RepID=A0A200PN00_MACCD|nr:hypothetical protein BVC80_7915g3 [Macleaya cordata]